MTELPCACCGTNARVGTWLCEPCGQRTAAENARWTVTVPPPPPDEEAVEVVDLAGDCPPEPEGGPTPAAVRGRILTAARRELLDVLAERQYAALAPAIPPGQERQFARRAYAQAEAFLAERDRRR